ncbi:unnamed protein product [Cuscuta campestris]|uniref:Uncharacterized protein n=1 Tax=Cuscuta campestris TaxID=132261 RepID=A0A484MK07_9ASTE|nr:unnamed protein product [Cuscuta campestris]
MVSLDSTNYSIWKIRIEDYLCSKDLLNPILYKESPTGVDEKAWTTLNRKAIASIRQYVSLSVLQHVANETNAFEMWKKLESMYERNNAMGKASLIRKLVKLQYKDGDSIVVHMNEFQGVVNQLAGMKMKLEDELQALLLLSSLPDSWDTLVVSLSNSAPDGKMTMEMVKASLLNEEARRKESGYPSQAEANVILESSRGRSKSRNPYYRDKSRGRSKSRKRDFICHYCQKPGHIERFCKKKKRDMSRERKDKNENSEQKPEEKNTTALASSDDDLFVIGDHGLLNVACDDCTWVIDSGASYHITSHREYFSSYTSGNFGHVRMGNDGSSKIVGMGDVCLETSTGCRLVLRDVRHVPDIRLSLISAGLLDDEGHANKFCDGRRKLSRGNLIMARGKKQNSLYVMQARVCSGDANVADDASGDLWHKRLGHMSQKGMQILSRKDYLPDISGMPLNSCVDCLAGKQHRVAFHTRPPHRRKHALDLVHTDVCSMDGRSQRGDVPQRVWSGKDVSYKHLRVFGCKDFVHIPRDERSKLDKNTKECIFLGYLEDVFGYTL